MTRRSTAPTMKDVAREAGVSLGTVSKVINGIPVGESYRRRVDAAIQTLGYQVNTYARGLKTNRTNCVALLMPSLHHPFFAVLTDELTRCLTRHGYRSMLMITNYDPQAEQKCFDLVRQNKVDGVIALTYSPDLQIDENIPIVMIDRRFNDSIPCVSSDNYRGGEIAAEKLLELGCSQLLFLCIGPDVSGEPDKRSMGFESVCRQRKANYDRVILRDEDTEAPFFTFLLEHIRDGRLDYDGIFCNTDGLACRVRDFLRAQDVSVPDDVQIIGYDGIINYINQKYDCSTIVQPVPDMAKVCVDLLLNKAGAAQPANISLPVRYAPGGTTKEACPDAPNGGGIARSPFA